MTDSYLPPENLAAARKRMDGMAGRVSNGGEIVRLTARPAETQLSSAWPLVDVVIADLVLWKWDRPALRALSERMKPDTVLLFLEPTADLGWRRLIHRYGRWAERLLLRHNFETDVPAELREAGLMVTTTIRFSTGPAGLRSYVLGRAEHIGI